MPIESPTLDTERKNMPRVILIVGMTLCAMTSLAVVEVHAACKLNVTVKNDGEAEKDVEFTVVWSESKYRGAGVWHKMCGTAKNPCRGNDKLSFGSAATQSFYAETQGCNTERKLRIYTKFEKTNNYTIDCDVEKQKDATAVDVKTQHFKVPKNKPPKNVACKTTPNQQQ